MVLFLPGLICDARTFAPQLSAFPEGRAIDGYGPLDRLDDMAQFVLDQAPERFDLFGHSMGGRVALEVYRLAPQRVRRLALVSTGVHGVQPGEADKRYALSAIGREQGFEALVDQWLPPMISKSGRSDPAIFDALHEMCLSQGQGKWDSDVEALLHRQEAESLLPTITCPTLVMTGENDAWSPPDQHAQFAAAIPGAQLVIVPDAGHMITHEAPKQVNEAIADWLAMPEATI